MHYQATGRLPTGCASATASILVVEDDPLVAAYICEVLNEAGFHVAGAASSGVEALNFAHDGVAAALVDIAITGPIDGVEVARQLHERHGIRSIFLSGAFDAGVIERAAGARPFSFLRKPFLPSQVCRAIDQALAESRKPQLVL